MKIPAMRLALLAAIEPGTHFWTREIFSHGVEEVHSRIIGRAYDPIKYANIIDKVSKFDADTDFAKISNAGAHLLTPEDLDWPIRVDDLESPPIALIVKGRRDLFTNPSLAIVGTRNPTPYGIRIAGDFAAGFVDREWSIVSGGAYGIDTHAHKGALIAEGVTIAVIAAGIDINYPAGNARLFAEIAELGCLVSEVTPGTPAIPSRWRGTLGARGCRPRTHAGQAWHWGSSRGRSSVGPRNARFRYSTDTRAAAASSQYHSRPQEGHPVTRPRRRAPRRAARSLRPYSVGLPRGR